jgi:hypothetical protein
MLLLGLCPLFGGEVPMTRHLGIEKRTNGMVALGCARFNREPY